jgi:hypothetical protein
VTWPDGSELDGVRLSGRDPKKPSARSFVGESPTG